MFLLEPTWFENVHLLHTACGFYLTSHSDVAAVGARSLLTMDRVYFTVCSEPVCPSVGGSCCTNSVFAEAVEWTWITGM